LAFCCYSAVYAAEERLSMIVATSLFIELPRSRVLGSPYAENALDSPHLRMPLRGTVWWFVHYSYW
jgi:hypothetical protein